MEAKDVRKMFDAVDRVRENQGLEELRRQARQTQLLSQLHQHLQKATGQIACSRDIAFALIPKPVELHNRLASMVKELERLSEEVTEYAKRNRK